VEQTHSMGRNVVARLRRRLLALTLGISHTLTGGYAFAQDNASEIPTLEEIVDAWLASPHGDRTSEAFTHWNKDGEIPGVCAVCHSSTGVIDYLRAPISAPGVIDHSVRLGTSVDCTACHTSAAADLRSVPFPSGVSVDTFGASAICTVCHQGRTSTATVETATSGLQDDVIAGDLSFINVHYAPSAATLMGGVVRGGFEYPGKSYKGQFTHVPTFNGCVDCHNPHTLEVNLGTCTTCHQGAQTFEDIRISPQDFDGDGNSVEGISDPITTLHTRLGSAIQQYATEVSGVPIVYDIHAYPYFFVDSDANTIASDAETVYPNRYQSWTPRLLKAAYNYQLVAKDPAIFTHNPHYALQLLFDSLESLGERTEMDMSMLVRP